MLPSCAGSPILRVWVSPPSVYIFVLNVPYLCMWNSEFCDFLVTDPDLSKLLDWYLIILHLIKYGLHCWHACGLSACSPDVNFPKLSACIPMAGQWQMPKIQTHEYLPSDVVSCLRHLQLLFLARLNFPHTSYGRVVIRIWLM